MFELRSISSENCGTTLSGSFSLLATSFLFSDNYETDPCIQPTFIGDLSSTPTSFARLLDAMSNLRTHRMTYPLFSDGVCESPNTILSPLASNQCYPHRLPVELLIKIFMLCLPSTSTGLCDAMPTPHPKIAPLLLCQVCRLWRGVARTTPFLWTRLNLGEVKPGVLYRERAHALAAVRINVLSPSSPDAASNKYRRYDSTSFPTPRSAQ